MIENAPAAGAVEATVPIHERLRAAMAFVAR
jgi:hypothetical protein